MNIEDKRDCIVKLFSKYLYGNLLPLEFHASTQGWSEWANLIRRFVDSLEHPKNKKHYNMQHEIERLQNEMVDFATTLHKSRVFPVMPYFKEKLYHGIKELFDELWWTMSDKLIKFLLEDNVDGITKMLPIINDATEGSKDIQMINKESEYLFKTYEILNGCPVTLVEEHRDTLGHGTTGLVSWQGAVALTCWATESEIFNQKANVSILELGSGLGLFGMTMLKMGHSFTFTDCHHAVLNFLVANSKINFDESVLETKDLDNWLNVGPPKLVTEDNASNTKFKMTLKSNNEQTLGVQYLDWTDFKKETLLDFKPDVIMGSDLVYDMNILPGLASLLQNLLEINRCRKTHAYISCTQRNHQSMETFLSCIKNEGLHYEVVFRRTFSPSDCIMISHEPLHAVTLFKITLKA